MGWAHQVSDPGEPAQDHPSPPTKVQKGRAFSLQSSGPFHLCNRPHSLGVRGSFFLSSWKRNGVKKVVVTTPNIFLISQDLHLYDFISATQALSLVLQVSSGWVHRPKVVVRQVESWEEGLG